MGMNKVILIGRLVKDPDLQFAKGSGMAICKFTLAVNRTVKKDNAPTADFFNCIAFDKRGETIAQYVHKGDQFAIIGQIQNRSYDDANGVKRYSTDIVVNEFDFIQGKKDNKPPENRDNVQFTEFNPNDYDEVPF
jgi:single-strand DNA-binding protein